jgi:hypothetical protein
MSSMSAEVAAAVLGVSIDATSEQVDTAWKARARVLHPDRFESGTKAQETASESMKQLNQARDAMVEYINKPKSKPSEQSSPTNTSNTTSGASTGDSKASEPSYRLMTPEEQEEERKLFRKAQVEEEKDVRKIISRTFAVHLSLLIIAVSSTLYCLLNIFSSNNVYFQIGVALFGTATFFLWNRTVVRWNSLMEVSRTVSAIKNADRRESREFKKVQRKNSRKKS